MLISNSRAQLIFDLLMLTSLLSFGLVLGCQRGQPKVETTASRFLKDYAIGMSSAFIQAAAAVENGAIKTDAELLEYLQPETAQARKQAAIGIDQYLENNLSNGELKKSDVTVLRDLGQQFRGAYGR